MFNDEDDKTFKFYQKILKELILPVLKHPDNFLKCIKTSGDYITFNNKEIIMDEPFHIFNRVLKNNNLSSVIFNPLNENAKSCSMQLLNDQIHILLSNSINLIIEQILKIKSDSTSSNEKIKLLPKCTKLTVRKWKNIYKITTATSFSKSLIEFSFSLKNDNLVQVDLKYPLFNILQTRATCRLPKITHNLI